MDLAQSAGNSRLVALQQTSFEFLTKKYVLLCITLVAGRDPLHQDLHRLSFILYPSVDVPCIEQRVSCRGQCRRHMLVAHAYGADYYVMLPDFGYHRIYFVFL